jgi:hypothetical protein
MKNLRGVDENSSLLGCCTVLTGKLLSKTRTTLLVEALKAGPAWTGVCSLLPAPHLPYQSTLSNNISDIPTAVACKLRAVISITSVVVSTLAIFLDFLT